MPAPTCSYRYLHRNPGPQERSQCAASIPSKGKAVTPTTCFGDKQEKQVWFSIPHAPISFSIRSGTQVPLVYTRHALRISYFIL